MGTKSAKAKSKKPGFRYTPEDLAPRDRSADETLVDAYTARNKEALNESIGSAHDAFERGEYFTLDQAMADLPRRGQRLRPRQP